MEKSTLDKECVFCEKIKDGSAEPYNTASYIFEPLNPVTPGHKVIIPMNHVDKTNESMEHFMGVVFTDAFNYANRFEHDYNLMINIGPVATQTIEHLHVHYVPRRPEDGLRLPWTP